MEATKKEIPVDRSSRIIWGIALWCIAMMIGVAGYLNAKKADKAAVVRNQAIIERIADDQKEIARLHTALEDRVGAMTQLRLSTDFGLVVLNKDGTIREWNKAMELWTGIKSVDAVGNNMAAAMTEENFAAHSAGLHSVFDIDSPPGETIVVRCELLNKDKPPLPVVVNARVVRSNNGNEAYAIALVSKEESVREVGKQ